MPTWLKILISAGSGFTTTFLTAKLSGTSYGISAAAGAVGALTALGNLQAKPAKMTTKKTSRTPMEPLIQLILAVLFFCIAVYAAKAICTYFKLPDPVLWIVGVFFLIILLYFISGHMGPLKPIRWGS